MTRNELIAGIHNLLNGNPEDLIEASGLLDVLESDGTQFFHNPDGVVTTVTVLRARIADAHAAIEEPVMVPLPAIEGPVEEAV